MQQGQPIQISTSHPAAPPTPTPSHDAAAVSTWSPGRLCAGGWVSWKRNESCDWDLDLPAHKSNTRSRNHTGFLISVPTFVKLCLPRSIQFSPIHSVSVSLTQYIYSKAQFNWSGLMYKSIRMA